MSELLEIHDKLKDTSVNKPKLLAIYERGKYCYEFVLMYSGVLDSTRCRYRYMNILVYTDILSIHDYDERYSDERCSDHPKDVTDSVTTSIELMMV